MRRSFVSVVLVTALAAAGCTSLLAGVGGFPAAQRTHTISTGEACRRGLAARIDKLADAVSVTLGPKGESCVSLLRFLLSCWGCIEVLNIDWVSNLVWFTFVQLTSCLQYDFLTHLDLKCSS